MENCCLLELFLALDCPGDLKETRYNLNDMKQLGCDFYEN